MRVESEMYGCARELDQPGDVPIRRVNGLTGSLVGGGFA